MDNRYHKQSCPSRMSDGRHFTDFRSRFALETDFFHPGSSEHQYRHSLQREAHKIVHTQRRGFTTAYACGR